MAQSKFTLPTEKPKGLLTDFKPPTTAAASYQTNPRQLAQPTLLQKTGSAIKKAAQFVTRQPANILDAVFPKSTYTGPPLPGPSVYDYGKPGSPNYIPAQVKPVNPQLAGADSGNFNQQFAGPGGNIDLGQGINVNNQSITEPSAEELVIQPAPIEEAAGASGAGAAGGGGSGSTGGAAGYSPGGFFEGALSPGTPGAAITNIRRDADNFYGIDAQGNQRLLSEQEAFTGGLGINEKFVQPGETVSLDQAREGFGSRFQKGFQKAVTDGISDVGDFGQEIVEQYSPAPRSNTTAAAFVQADPYMTGLVQAWQQYIDPQNQKASLTETYQQMIKSSGIEALDTELLNSKNIIEGTEDDIRREISSAGGFASESQVVALANARNKSLIKNYNTLLETRNAKERYIQTAIGLESQDRQIADQRFESMFSMGLQIADYRQKMQRNAIESFERTRAAIGWQGILQATNGDPNEIGMIERGYGLPPGGLQLAAQQEAQARAFAEEERSLEIEKLRADIAKSQQGQIFGNENIGYYTLGLDGQTKQLVGPGTEDGQYTKNQIAALSKLNENVSKNDTYKKTTSMRTFANNVVASLQAKNGVSDIAAINQFQKVIDEGAVTRDQDVKLLEGAQSLSNQLKQRIKKLEKGDKLSDTQRSQMRELVEKLYTTQVQALQNDPYIQAKTREAELNGLTIDDTILGELEGFGVSGQESQVPSQVRDVVNKLVQTQTPSGDIVNKLLEPDSPVRDLVLEFQRNRATPEEIRDYFLGKDDGTGPVSSSSARQIAAADILSGFSRTPIEDFKKSIIQQESGGSYSAVGIPTEHGVALGKYQIIPKFWFSKIGLNPNSKADRQRFLKSKELQDRAFSLVIADLGRKYNNNPTKMAAAYYGGAGAVKKLGTRAANVRQQGGRAPSINEYVRSVLSRLPTIGDIQIQRKNISNIG